MPYGLGAFVRLHVLDRVADPSPNKQEIAPSCPKTAKIHITRRRLGIVVAFQVHKQVTRPCDSACFSYTFPAHRIRPESHDTVLL